VRPPASLPVLHALESGIYVNELNFLGGSFLYPFPI
jgi:hypothetical protein